MPSGKFYLLGMLIFIYMVSAFMLPYVEEFLGEESTTTEVFNQADEIRDSIKDESSASDFNPLNVFEVFINVYKLALVGVSGLPLWLDLIYSFMGVMMVILLISFIPTID